MQHIVLSFGHSSGGPVVRTQTGVHDPRRFVGFTFWYQWTYGAVSLLLTGANRTHVKPIILDSVARMIFLLLTVECKNCSAVVPVHLTGTLRHLNEQAKSNVRSSIQIIPHACDERPWHVALLTSLRTIIYEHVALLTSFPQEPSLCVPDFMSPPIAPLSRTTWSLPFNLQFRNRYLPAVIVCNPATLGTLSQLNDVDAELSLDAKKIMEEAHRRLDTSGERGIKSVVICCPNLMVRQKVITASWSGWEGPCAGNVFVQRVE